MEGQWACGSPFSTFNFIPVTEVTKGAKSPGTLSNGCMGAVLGGFNFLSFEGDRRGHMVTEAPGGAGFHKPMAAAPFYGFKFFQFCGPALPLWVLFSCDFALPLMRVFRVILHLTRRLRAGCFCVLAV